MSGWKIFKHSNLLSAFCWNFLEIQSAASNIITIIKIKLPWLILSCADLRPYICDTVMMNNYDGRVTRDMWHNDVTSGQYWPFVSCCQLDLKLFLNSKQTFPVYVWAGKSNKKANIGKYFILGIQGTIDIVTTWTWLTLTHAWGSVQCLLISFPQPLQSPHHASVKAWRYHGHQQRWTGSVQNQSCVQIIQSLCQGITNNILSISGLWELFSLPRCNYPDGSRGVVTQRANIILHLSL